MPQPRICYAPSRPGEITAIHNNILGVNLQNNVFVSWAFSLSLRSVEFFLNSHSLSSTSFIPEITSLLINRNSYKRRSFCLLFRPFPTCFPSWKLFLPFFFIAKILKKEKCPICVLINLMYTWWASECSKHVRRKCKSFSSAKENIFSLTIPFSLNLSTSQSLT